MNKLIKMLSLMYVFLIPFYDIPKTFRSGISISGIIIITMLFIDFIGKNVMDKKINVPTKMLISFSPLIFIFIITSLININSLDVKSVNHIGFYIYSFIIYTYGTYFVIRRFGRDFFTRILSYSIIVISIIGFIEMSIYYIYGFNAYANFLNHGINVGVHAGIPRLRSTFNEPSHLALFLIPIFPLLIYSKNRISIMLAIITFLFTLSTSAFIGVGLSFIIIIPLFILKRKININKKLITIILLLLVPFIYYLAPSILNILRKGLDVKETDAVRYNAWVNSFRVFVKSPIIGNGMASYYSFAPLGVFSWYIQLMVETGILGMLSLIGFFIPVFQKIYKKKDIITLFFLIAYLIQMISMNHYYIPGIWVLVGFIYANGSSNKDIDLGKWVIKQVKIK